MPATAFDAFMTPFDAACVPIFLMRPIRTAMWKVVVVAHPHVVFVHATEAFQRVGHFDSVRVTPLVLVFGFGCRLGARLNWVLRTLFLSHIWALR